MPCYSPLKGYYAKTLNSSGKRSIVFSQREALDDQTVSLNCGQCIGCRLEKSRQWALRCVHEASLYENNCFLTLTYAPENLPDFGSLHLPDFQKFMKRLRKFASHRNIRFFHCGEYGEKLGRPHYHACIFNYDFNDKKLLRETSLGHNLYTSEKLSKLWPLGHSTIGDLTFETAAYTARYVMKKITGPAARHHYMDLAPDGEILRDRTPEYTTMSRRPGIGRPWLDKYLSDIYPDDFVIFKNKKLRPPKFYDSVLENTSPFEHDDLKERRQKTTAKQKSNSTYERLRTRETIHELKAKTLKRNYEK